MPARQAFEAIVFVLSTGIQWKALPSVFGSSSSVHRYFQEWTKAGLFLKIWKRGLAEYDEMSGIAWRWQSVDGCITKAPTALESVGRNPKMETKRHVLVDGRGVPLSIVVTGANRHDVPQLAAVLDGSVVRSEKRVREHLCADAGYAGAQALRVILERGYIPHVRSREEEKKAKKRGRKARRWVVEVSHSWMNRFRKLLVRFEKKTAFYLALLHLAAGIIALKRVKAI